MNELQIFNNEEFGQVRAVDLDGTPWFVGKDVAEILGYQNASKALMDHVDDEDKLNNESLSSLGQRGGWLINESGVYALVFGSKLPVAKKFKRWVTAEVLPQIRQTGGYQLPQTYPEALRALADKAEEVERLALENADMKPKADFYDDVAGSKDAIQMADVAKVLNMGIGRNKLFEILRNEGILDSRNIPYQRFIDAGYFRTIEQKYNKPNGDVCIRIKTLVYQKGVEYIRKVVINAKKYAEQNGK